MAPHRPSAAIQLAGLARSLQGIGIRGIRESQSRWRHSVFRRAILIGGCREGDTAVDSGHLRHVRHRLHRGECRAVVAQRREAPPGRGMVDAHMSDSIGWTRSVRFAA